jgi:hypothetical protein
MKLSTQVEPLLITSAMIKHFILHFDPHANYEWDRCSLRDPITADRPALADLVAAAIGQHPGAYLVAVNIDVQVLERSAPSPTALELPALPTRPILSPLPELVA